MGAGKSKPMGALQAVRPAAVLSETPITTYPSFKLILVRHGVSCANLKKAMGQSFSSYKDPELTRAGQEKAINRGILFQEYLEAHELFNPIVAASVLMRAQQTALLMMSPDYRNKDYLEKIAIAPYVSEKGPAYWFQTDDNKPYRKEEQARILSIQYKTPALVGRRMYIPEPFPVDAQTPSPAKFIQWLTDYYATMSKVVPSLQMNESEPPNTRRRELMNWLEQHRVGVGAGAPVRTPAEIETERKVRVELAKIDLPSLRRPVILFTHGNYIQQFIKYVTKASPVRIEKSDRPNYSAFSFTVEMRPVGFHITYDGPVSYAAELDSNSELRYNESNTIDAKGECAGGGDRCISAACPPSATRIKRPLADILQEQAVMRKLAKNIATLPQSNAGIPQLTEANVRKAVKNSRQTPPLPNNGNNNGNNMGNNNENNNTTYSVEEEEEEEEHTGGYRRKLKRKTHKRKMHKRKTHKRRR
jgi:bisphosphoglycerate-dependent phosphoglycerate mutase